MDITAHVLFLAIYNNVSLFHLVNLCARDVFLNDALTKK